MHIIIHPADEVKDQPQVDIVAWSIHGVSFHNENEVVHLLTGFVLDKKWRVTTAIQHFDSDNKRITTNSGRVYNLLGQPGSKDAELELAWQIWKMTNNVSSDVDVTDEYATKIKWFVM
ncbi:MAG: hypothetical protein M8364_12795 [Methylobacter sp.]|uniref:hypothetical protein n=1 Tax=Methylobacter sp. TaxID=2051955 RepID=UPI00258AF608|nr:hypothetical protein [Methylobacter sp.]MCL7421773.1 hypothetical protein [Methylobacter sp.]